MIYPYRCAFTLHHDSRSRSTVLTRHGLSFFQLQGLVIQHPPFLSPTVLPLISTNLFAVPFLSLYPFSAINISSIDTPLRWSLGVANTSWTSTLAYGSLVIFLALLAVSG
jgi:hypothetical protein